MENNEESIIIENSAIETIEATQRAEYDIQIATAKKYPRDLIKVKNNALAIITMDKQIAESCRYALPRDGKSISGPSVHLARILSQQYGNLRADSRVKQITNNQIISEAICFDLETNYAVKVEVRKSIVGKRGRYSDDMIVVTGNAANAIAFRNAVFSVIPKGLTDICYKKSMEMITGDLSDETKLIQARAKSIKYFIDTYACTENDILSVLGLKAITQIKSEHIADLRGLMQSLIDGDTTPEQTFKSLKPVLETKNIDKINDDKEKNRFIEFINNAQTLDELGMIEQQAIEYGLTEMIEDRKKLISSKNGK
jgi:hypothetical protein